MRVQNEKGIIMVSVLADCGGQGIKAASLLLSGQRANEGPPSALSQQFTLRRMKLGAPRPLGVLGQRATVKQCSIFPHTYWSKWKKTPRSLQCAEEEEEQAEMFCESRRKTSSVPAAEAHQAFNSRVCTQPISS